jgi:hypothetical protein
MNQNESNTIILDFANQNIPQPTESRNTSDSTFVNWGLNNQYPVFLLDLFSQSSIHSAIVNQKTNYIIGDGLRTANSDKLDLLVNASDDIKEFSAKIIKDYILFNAFAVEVVFNVFGVPVEFYHVPMNRLRMNKSKTKFFYCEDWLLSRKHVIYDRYSVKQNQDSTSKIFYFDGYFPSVNLVYPTPEYNGTIRAIVTDIAINEFNLNNIKNHFSPSTIITFFNGNNVSEKVKEQIINDLETKFRGENGKKFIIDFQHKDGKSAEINQLSANDWDKAYLEVSNKNTDNILIGHQVQNPSLFGIKTAGQLGSSQELEVSYEIFKNNYIKVKRAEGVSGRLEFVDKPLFNERLSDAAKEKVLTINELRKIGGFPSLPDGDRILAPVAPANPATTPVVQAQEPATEKKKSGYKLTEEDYQKISHLGLAFEEFEVLEELGHVHESFDLESDIASYLIGNDLKGLTLPQLVKVLEREGGLKTSENDLQGILDKLSKSGVLSVEVGKDNRLTIAPLPKPEIPDTAGVSVMYKYVKKAEIAGADIIPTSRDFCVKMIENNRFYTREDIQTMSSIFGYDVFKHAGGYYYDPVQDKTFDSCRHKWQMVRVKRKAN